MNEQPQFLTKAKFSQMVEEARLADDRSNRANRISYMDSIMHLCEKHGIEIEDVKKYLTPTIKSKVEAEAKRLNFLKEKSNPLPI